MYRAAGKTLTGPNQNPKPISGYNAMPLVTQNFHHHRSMVTPEATYKPQNPKSQAQPPKTINQTQATMTL